MSSDQEFPDEHSTKSTAELRTQVEILAEENDALRRSYTQARQTQYRRTALWLVGVGLIAVAGGLLVPDARTVLFALGGAGLFGGVLTYYLTPEQFVSASVGREIYTALAGNERALVAELGLSDHRLYLPVDGAESGVRLFVPQKSEFALPDRATLDGQLIVTGGGATSGLTFEPSGGRLFGAVERAVQGDIAVQPERLAEQLTDALVEQFELVDAAEPDLDADGRRLTVAVSGSVYGPVDRFDHPVRSLLATGFATALDSPVYTEVADLTDARDEYLITLRWGDDQIEPETAAGVTS